MKNATAFEYWETRDARHGGVILGANENSLRVRSLADIRIGEEFGINIFFSFGSGFDRIEILTRIIGKDLGCEEGWEVYEYKLEFIGISESDLDKLRDFLRIRQPKSAYS